MTAARPVNLLSDTVTEPTDAMRRAMFAAPVGDDVYGADPTMNALQERVADQFGHEAALFMPSGSLSNIIGVATLCEPGTEMICDLTAHVVRAEMGAHGAVTGITTRTVGAAQGPRQGLLDATEMLAAATPDAGPYLVSTRVLAYENTHNFGGGRVQPLDQIEALYAGARERGLAVHLDGARLFNAMVATGIDARTYGGLADSVSLCFSKGLGAPVGSLLLGSRERIAAARVLRKRLGGGLRQIGILAAAMEYALDHHVARLAEDHAAAQAIARAAHEAMPSSVDPASVETNIVVLTVPRAQEVAATLADRGVLVAALGPSMLRAVTHLNVTPQHAATAADAIASALADC
ncbi:low specificity L-threonine aldolase [Micrococcales bacterium 31B]|nr:low specificity L-threonine aldolase [Micrococcales bacterium 31B]